MLEMTDFLVCPRCRGSLTRSTEGFACQSCQVTYPFVEEVPQFDPPADEAKGDDAQRAAGGNRDQRRSYWDQGWQARFQSDHAFLNQLTTQSAWQSYLEQQIVQLGNQRHVSVVEASREAIGGKVLLDIGCGAGTSGALFGYRGARYIGVDHSRHAATYTLRHLRAVGGEGFTLQGNADSLPIRTGSIDVVYSNGVLHHTPRFATAMDEAYRVLRPGGKAIIALYATYSTAFGLVRVLGALRGNLSRNAMDRWMGAASEGAWRTQGRFNLWTQTFSKAQLRQLAGKYSIGELALRKNGNPIGEFPRLGGRLMKFNAVRKLDRALEPLFGSMLIMSFSKGRSS